MTPQALGMSSSLSLRGRAMKLALVDGSEE